MANRFARYLRDLLPRTGRIITERGTYVNEADLLERMRAGSDPFGNTWVAEYTPIVERKPLPGFSALRDRLDGAGSATVAGGEIQLDGTAGITSLYTRDYGRYIPGVYAIAGIGVRFSAPGVGTYEYGYGNSSGNRVGLEVVDGDFFTFVEAGGNRYYRKPRAEWLDPLDGTGPSGLTLNESQHVLRIKMGWYGYLSLSFYIAINDRVLGEQLVLVDRNEDRDGVNLEQPDLPIFAEATGGVLNIGGRQFGVLGRYRPEFRNTGGFAGLASVGTSFVPLCSFRVKNTVQWRGVPIKISGATVLATENTDIAIIVGGTLTGASFSAVPGIDSSETALEFDTSATAISGGYRAFTDNVAGGSANRSGSRGADVPDLQIPRDQVCTLAVRAISAPSDVEGTLRMREEW